MKPTQTAGSLRSASPASQDLRTSVKILASEDEEGEDDDEEEEDDKIRGPEGRARVAAERQRRVWNADPGRRDDVLPYLVWSIVHDEDRSAAELKAFLKVQCLPRLSSRRCLLCFELLQSRLLTITIMEQPGWD